MRCGLLLAGSPLSQDVPGCHEAAHFAVAAACQASRWAAARCIVSTSPCQPIPPRRHASVRMASSAMAARSLDLQVVEGLAKKRGERFAFDCYRRLLDMFGDVVLGIEHEKFEEHIHAVKVRGRAGAHSWHSLLFNISWGWSWVRNARRPPCHPICAC